MVKKNTIVEYADTLDELRSKTIGLNHDRCYAIFSGLTKKLPENLIKLASKSKKFIAIYEEDIPSQSQPTI